MSIIRPVIRGTGHYLPERVVPNSEFASILDTSDDWIVSRSGIERRHFVAEGEFHQTLRHMLRVPPLKTLVWTPARLTP